MASLLTVFLNLSFEIPKPYSLEPAISNRVINGDEIDITNVPYQANIHRKNESGWWYLCGAAIIHKKALLTAAHCIELFALLLKQDYRYKKIVIKSHIRVNVGTSVIDSGGYYYNLSKIIVHRDYPMKFIQADIAFLVLDKNMIFNDKVNYIPVAPADYDIADQTEAIVSGFGTTTNTGPNSKVLKAAKVYITNHVACTRVFIPITRLTHSVICANATDPPRDACKGDSGGPLVAKGYLIGIVSFGVECAHPIYPGVYTRVSYFHEWIKTQLQLEIDYNDQIM